MKIITTQMLKYLMIAFCTVILMTPACTTTPEPKPAENADTASKAAPSPSMNVDGGAVIQEGVPGGIIVNTIEISAKVVAIDYTARKATLLGPDGKKFQVKPGPEAVNFDQVQEGDMLDLRLTEEIVIRMEKDDAASPDGIAGVVALAPKGAKPGGLVAETVKITAVIDAIDTTARTATLEFQDGSSKTVSVRPDIDLSLHKPGERVVFYMTEMIAISLKKSDLE